MNRILFLFFFLACSLGMAQSGFPQNIIIDDSFGIFSPNTVLGRDLNNDGKNDMLIIADSKIYWNKNNANALNGFEHPVLIYKHTDTVKKIEGKDINADGKMDIIFSSENGLFLMKGTGGVPAFENPVLLTNVEKITYFNIIDIDSDGDLDIYWHQNNAALLKNNDGNGNFSTTQVVFSNYPPEVIGIKDLDNDNKPDIFAKSGKYGLKWYKNDGTGNFTLKQDIDNGAFTQVLDAGDIDGDGDIDILSLYENGSDTKFIWYSNLNGLGNFSGPKVISAVPYIFANIQNVLPQDTGKYRFKLIDIDNDNKPDLVFSVYWDAKVSWKKNLGNGNFGPENIINSNTRRITNFDVADFNGDSKLDVVSSSEGDDKVAWCQSIDGLGNFGPEKITTTSIFNPDKAAVGDLDGDGYKDVIVASVTDNKISWYKNTNGLGDFSGLQKIIRNNLQSVKDIFIADLDGDGDNDFAVRYEYKVVYSTFARMVWFENDGAGNFTIEHIIEDALGPNQILYMTYGDFDHDGDIDLVTVAGGNNVSWYKNNGSGVFEAPVRFSAIEYKGTNTLISADMDGDGDLDILVASDNKDIEWYENVDGLGNFSTRHVVIDQVNNTGISVGDIDGDGDNDILFLQYGASTIGWFENLGQGNFGPKNVLATTPNIFHPTSIMAFDVDGDGIKDIVASSSTQPKLRWYKSNGNGTFGSATLLTNNIGSVRPMLDEDLNGDGVSELVVISSAREIGDPNMLAWFETKSSFQNKINGKIRYDIDNNGCDANDVSATMIMVSTQSPTHKYSTFTNGNGEYSLIAKQGQYTTFVDTLLPNYTINPQNHSYNFISTGITDIADFCIVPNQEYKDIEMSIYPTLTARPGFDTKYKIVIANKGTQKVSGDIVFNYNGTKMNFLQASAPVASQANGNINFSYQDLAPFHTKTIELKFNVLPMLVNNIGGQLSINASANVVGDVTPFNNEFTLQQTIVGSYDPNDITVLEGSQILLQNADEYLHYVIRFQNTGNHFAEKVKIHNVLDNKLDGSTLILEAFSHPNEAKITDGNDIEFNFNAIYLPGSSDEQNSHGFIAYKVKPKANVQVNDIISNVADIYFDYNPAIATNTVSTKIVDLVLGTNEQTRNTIKIYPNPTTGIINLNIQSLPEKIEVHNISGQMVRSFRNNNRIDISDLPAGIYLLKITSKNEGQIMVKIIKK